MQGQWTTEGWWNVAARTVCETIMPGPLVSRFYYVYAIDYDQGGVWGGKAIMCTRDKMFTIAGIEDCVARGYERTGFFEVDTGEQKSWTVQLTAARRRREAPADEAHPQGQDPRDPRSGILRQGDDRNGCSKPAPMSSAST